MNFRVSLGGFLLGRTLAAVLTVTLSTSMAARLGAIPMAAHQICLQVWLSASLLADAQAASGQVNTIEVLRPFICSQYEWVSNYICMVMDIKGTFPWNISLSQLRDLVGKSVVLNRLQLTVSFFFFYDY